MLWPRSFCKPISYKAKLSPMLPWTNLLTPHLFLYVSTHESLSNLSCAPHLLPLPPRPLRSLVLSPRSLEDILAVETLLCFCPESRSFLSNHSHYFCHWVFGLFGHFSDSLYLLCAVTARLILARLHFRYYLRDPTQLRSLLEMHYGRK